MLSSNAYAYFVWAQGAKRRKERPYEGMHGRGRDCAARAAPMMRAVTDLVPLSTAAAAALARLVPARVAQSKEAQRSAELLGQEIAARIPVYARDLQSGALSRVSPAELHVPGKELLVKRADMEAVVELLVAEYVGAAPRLPAAAPTGIARRRSARRYSGA